MIQLLQPISRWAQSHPTFAKLLLGISYTLIGLIGVFLGFTSVTHNILIPSWILIVILLIFMTLHLIYPSKQNQWYGLKHSYGRQKIADFLLVMCTFCLVFLGTNDFLNKLLVDDSSLSSYVHQNARAKLVVEKKIFNVKPSKVKPFLFKKKSFKGVKKQIKEFIKEQKDEEKNFLFLKIFLTFLTIVAAVGLGVLVAALSCNISCSGYQGLALGILIAGWAMIIVLSILLIRTIFKRIGKNKVSG